jgi:hypothetical protein
VYVSDARNRRRRLQIGWKRGLPAAISKKPY